MSVLRPLVFFCVCKLRLRYHFTITSIHYQPQVRHKIVGGSITLLQIWLVLESGWIWISLKSPSLLSLKGWWLSSHTSDSFHMRNHPIWALQDFHLSWFQAGDPFNQLRATILSNLSQEIAQMVEYKSENSFDSFDFQILIYTLHFPSSACLEILN